ncbi:MAG: Ig-like domain-containing protein [Nitrospira sp.]
MSFGGNKVMHSGIRIGMLVLLCLTLSACGKKNSSFVGTPQTTAPSIQVNIVNGETFQFSAAALSASGTVVWDSDDPSIVTVDANGLATAKSIGVVRITVRPVSGAVTGSALVGVVSPDPGNPFSLSGRAEYEDRPVSQSGLGAPVPMPIRNAVIKVIAIDGFTELASGLTDEQGNYVGLPSSIDASSKRGGIYVQVVTQTDPQPGNPTQVEIRNNLTDQALLSVISSAFDNSSPGTPFIQDVLAPAAGIGGAFNILDVFSKSGELIEGTGLCPFPSTGPACPLPLLTGYWEPGGSEGTFFATFSNQSNAIFICGGGVGDVCIAEDSDEYDDAVIAHEYGHFILAQFSHDDSPGGFHGISENDQDIRLSWSEGWANFFSSAVRSNPVYVDTNTNGGTIFFFDIEDPSSPLRPGAIYTTSELAVAGILWDILDGLAPTDPTAVDTDPLDLTFEHILQLVMSTPFLSRQATMESFWLAFEAERPGTETDDLQFILKDRQIELFPDEGDKTVELNLIAGGGAQHHTLYLSGPNPFEDEDKILFDVELDEVYTLETLNLTNGADTFLTIKDSIDNPLFTFDNRGGISYFGCGVDPDIGISTCPKNGGPPFPEPLSSTNTWTAQATERLSVLVMRSPFAPPSAGQFGSYDIQLTLVP